MSETPNTINGIAQNPPGIPMFQALPANPKTLRIVSDDTPAGFVVINAEDFDPATMTRYDDA
ncbi:hypothetical protein [Gemmatimonas sp.]